MCPYDHALRRAIAQHLEDVGIIKVLANMVLSYLPPETCPPDTRIDGSDGCYFVSRCTCTEQQRDRRFVFAGEVTANIRHTAVVDPMLRLVTVSGYEEGTMDFSQQPDQNVRHFSYDHWDKVVKIGFFHDIKVGGWAEYHVSASFLGSRQNAQDVMIEIGKVARATGTAPLIRDILKSAKYRIE